MREGVARHELVDLQRAVGLWEKRDSADRQDQDDP